MTLENATHLAGFTNEEKNDFPRLMLWYSSIAGFPPVCIPIDSKYKCTYSFIHQRSTTTSTSQFDLSRV